MSATQRNRCFRPTVGLLVSAPPAEDRRVEWAHCRFGGAFRVGSGALEGVEACGGDGGNDRMCKAMGACTHVAPIISTAVKRSSARRPSLAASVPSLSLAYIGRAVLRLLVLCLASAVCASALRLPDRPSAPLTRSLAPWRLVCRRCRGKCLLLLSNAFSPQMWASSRLALPRFVPARVWFRCAHEGWDD